MKQQLALTTLLVANYDEALDFYVKKVGFELVEDGQLDDTKRWVVVRPPGMDQGGLLLAQAVGEKQKKAIGNQSGGRVFLFLHTDDFERDYQRMRDAGVKFKEKPRHEVYGTVAVFEDLYGNLWDLLEPKGQ